MSRDTDLLLMLDENAQRQALRARQVMLCVDIAVATVVGVLCAWAVLTYLTPCESGALCIGVAAKPVRAGLWRRLHCACKAWYLRRLIEAAERDLIFEEEDLRLMPQQISNTRLHLSALRVELIDCDLVSRRN